MLCPRCNNEVGNNNFCPHCGANVVNSPIRGINIVITRQKKLLGAIIDFPVFIDDSKLGDLKNGESLRCSLGVGKHKVTFKLFEKDVSQEIDVTGNNAEIEIICAAKLGLLTAVPKIVDVQYK